MPDGKPGDAPPAEGTTVKVVFDATGGGNREKGLNFKASVGRSGKVGP